MSHRVPSKILMRAVVCVVVGLGVTIAATPSLGIAGALLAGWAAYALCSVVAILVRLWPMDAEQTRERARKEDPGRRVRRSVAIVGSNASLGAVAVLLIQTRHASVSLSILLDGVAVVAVASSWALIQVDYMLQYANMFYADPIGGISFNQSEDPSYTDFAYFSIGLGLTYQVADTNVSTNAIRRLVIAQTLLAYLFGAVILATIINLVAGLG